MTGVIVTLMAIWMVICSSGCGGPDTVRTDPAVSCASVARLSLPNTQITKAEFVPANSTPSTTYPNLPDMPENCLIQGTVDTRIGVPAPPMDQFGNLTAGTGNPIYAIQFELRMPTT